MRLERLRLGEWVMGLASVALVVVLFALPWYGFTGVYAPTAATLGVKASYNGISSLHVLGVLSLFVAVGGISAWLLQSSRAAPALPVCATVLTVALDSVLFVGLAVRVLIVLPVDSSLVGAKVGAYAGLALSLALLLGAYLSLRADGILAADAPAEIETLRLHRPPDRAAT